MFVNSSTTLLDIEIVGMTEYSDVKTNTDYIVYKTLILTSNTASYEVDFTFSYSKTSTSDPFVIIIIIL